MMISKKTKTRCNCEKDILSRSEKGVWVNFLWGKLCLLRAGWMRDPTAGLKWPSKVCPAAFSTWPRRANCKGEMCSIFFPWKPPFSSTIFPARNLHWQFLFDHVHYRWTDGMMHTRFPLTHMYISVSTGLFVNLLMCFYLHIDRCWRTSEKPQQKTNRCIVLPMQIGIIISQNDNLNSSITSTSGWVYPTIWLASNIQKVSPTLNPQP